VHRRSLEVKREVQIGCEGLRQWSVAAGGVFLSFLSDLPTTGVWRRIWRNITLFPIASIKLPLRISELLSLGMDGPVQRGPSVVVLRGLSPPG
jgi:hypothetical protein